MNTKMSFAIALASLLALGGSAMAASNGHNVRASESYAQPYGGYVRAQAPFDAYAAVPGAIYGRSDVSASQPGWNPALDRAKGSF